MNSILKQQDANTGGFFATYEEAAAGKGRIDFDTTSVATQACIWTGHMDQALRAGEYFLALDALQPEIDRRYYFVMDSDGKLVTDPGNDSPTEYYQEKGTPLQLYYKTGLFAALMSYLNRVRPNKRYIEAAIRCVDFAANCSDDVLRTRFSHKLCWGAAELYQETHEPRFREIALRFADFLIDVQEPDGRWIYRELFDKPEDQPIVATFDMTAQQVCWIGKAREIY